MNSCAFLYSVDETSDLGPPTSSPRAPRVLSPLLPALPRALPERGAAASGTIPPALRPVDVPSRVGDTTPARRASHSPFSRAVGLIRTGAATYIWPGHSGIDEWLLLIEEATPRQRELFGVQLVVP